MKYIIKPEIIGVNNNRNHILACFNVCSNCKCFHNNSTNKLNFSQLCLKNKIIKVIDRIRLLTLKDFDDYFLFNKKKFKVDCFVSKEKGELKL